jgi:cell division protein FtsN
MSAAWVKGQRGGFAMGLVAGLLVGLAVALAVALYITKAPIPFVNKVPLRTAEHDTAEAERNRTWDPNAPLGGKPAPNPQAAAQAAAASAAAAAAAASGAPPAVAAVAQPASVAPAASRPAARDPAAILAGAPTPAPPPPPAPAAPAVDPFVYFVQTGAFARSEDAEQQRARLGLLGLSARITEREQAGRTMHRVRLGPFPTRDEADMLQTKLQEQTIEAQIVRVEKP